MERTENKTRIGIMACANRRAGQMSVELLVVIGFLMLVLIPIISIGYNAIYGETWRLDVRQSGTVTTAIVTVANHLALAGEGSTTTYTIYLPSRVREMKTTGRELMISVDTPQLGIVDQVSVADVKLQLDPAYNWKDITGTYILKLSYVNGRVFITRFE